MIAPDSYQQFAAVQEAASHGIVLHVFGDVDQSSAASFEEAIDRGLALDSALLIDLTKCRYLDSSGLTVLVRIRTRVGSPLTVLVKQKSFLHRLLHMVGFDQILRIVTELETRADADRAHVLATGSDGDVPAGEDVRA